MIRPWLPESCALCNGQCRLYKFSYDRGRRRVGGSIIFRNKDDDFERLDVTPSENEDRLQVLFCSLCFIGMAKIINVSCPNSPLEH